jgi:hypothetical protein
MLDTDRIVSARITPLPHSLLDPLPEVWITTANGEEVKLFDYYPDEISFTPDEFVSLTIAEAKRLKFKKDRDYLRS